MVWTLVNKGFTLHVPAESLGGEKSKKITVSWSQWLGSRSQEYYVCNYTITSDRRKGVTGLLYVQTDKLEEFKSKKTDGEDITFTVDETFQYGSNDDVTIFFLVFHDKDNKPFQHRFIKETISRLEGQAADFIGGLGLKSQAESFIGEYLMDYER
ncbi:uncharacterized protein J4E88_003077 [Alternaria novae-zelandiae]|uniref:uncharacterized protein n=1 Tax=Alternaria novae-zelandiae TaxID=430562 RepID=UPI0020C2EFDA|nr:uncharacterized protein J4E88_003077 [Alternaria novae-zelandiae]KAI4687488.1 hypothetical protein J4E88_003077 [Alternaria novae-zelandiae]